MTDDPNAVTQLSQNPAQLSDAELRAMREPERLIAKVGTWLKIKDEYDAYNLERPMELVRASDYDKLFDHVDALRKENDALWSEIRDVDEALSWTFDEYTQSEGPDKHNDRAWHIGWLTRSHTDCAQAQRDYDELRERCGGVERVLLNAHTVQGVSYSDGTSDWWLSTEPVRMPYPNTTREYIDAIVNKEATDATR